MDIHNKTLNLLASKLGIEEEKVLNKAAELLRLLHTRSTAGSNLSDSAKIVICLDIAASMLNANLDIKTAIKCSGLKPTAYNNSKKMCENLLELNSEVLSIAILCTVLQCAEVQSLAEEVLAEYQKQAKMELDLNLPQYVCMAVFQACRIKKVKVSKSKIIEKSRLTHAQWSKLDADWTKFTDTKFTSETKGNKKKIKQTKAAVDIVEPEDKMEIEEHIPTEEVQIESYQDWKKRMLETAYKELQELEMQKSVTPRKSPRKSVQKFSPYKSPSKTKTNGVRLLFPL